VQKYMHYFTVWGIAHRKEPFNMLKSRKIHYILALFMSLFCINNVMGWVDGDEITVSGFDWNNINSESFFYYVDNADGNKVKQCSTKKIYVWHDNMEESHVCTTQGIKIHHFHYQYDWGQGAMATSSQANAYWNARFCSPYICMYLDSPTNVYNCITYACKHALQGTYNYWFDGPDYSFPLVLYNDAQWIQDKYNVASGDMLIYNILDNDGHATYVGYTANGYPIYKVWKYNASGIYAIDDSWNFDTPMCIGGAIVNTPIDQQGWSWWDGGAGYDDGYGSMGVYRAK
jgi:hypothetical protein